MGVDRERVKLYTTILLESRIFIIFLSSYKTNLKELNKNGGSSRNVHSLSLMVTRLLIIKEFILQSHC